MRSLALSALLALLACAPAARAETVLGVGGLALEGRVVALEGDGPGRALLVETRASGAAGTRTARVPLEDAVEIHYGRAAGEALGEGVSAAESVAPRTILFENGDRLEGDLVRIEAERLLLATQRLGRLSVPLGAVRGVLHPRPGVPEAAAAAARAAVEGSGAQPEDVLFLANGDRSEGVIARLARGRVEMEHLALGKRVIVDLHDVIALRFARLPGAERPRPARGVLARLEMLDGSRLSGPLLEASTEKMRIAWPDPGSKRGLAVPVRELERVSFRGGRLVWLSDLEPAARTEQPLLGPAFALGRDRTTTGRPLAIAGRAFRRGLGTRARSRYTWKLDGAFEAFESSIGIDDEAGAASGAAGRGEGCGLFRVLVDGKERYGSGPVRGGEAARYVRVPLAGAHQITLCVDEAEGLDLADLADWAEAHLVRPKGKESTE